MIRRPVLPARLREVPPAVAVAALVLVAAALRAWDLDHMSIWQDEGLSLYRASQGLRAILSGEIPLGRHLTHDVQPPLYFVLLAAWRTFVGPSIWAGKWLSLLVGLPAVPLVWVLARRWVGRAEGLLAAALAALSPVYLWYAQELRSYTLVVSLGLAAVVALGRALEDGPPAGRQRWALACGLANATLVWTHYLGFFLVAAEALFLLAFAVARRADRARRPGRALAGLALAAVATLPLVPYALWRLGIGPERDQHFVPPHVMAIDLVNGFSLGLSVDFARVAWLDLAFLGLVGLGAAVLWRRRRATGAALLAYLLGPPALLFLVTLVKPVYMGVRHVLVSSPPYYVLLAAGLAGLWRRSPAAALGAGALVFGGMLGSDAAFYADPAFQKDDLRGLAAYVDAHALSGDVLAVSHPVLALAFEQLVHRVPVIALPEMLPSGAPDPRPPSVQLLPVLERHTRLWFMTPADDLAAWLASHAVHVDRREFEGYSIPVRVDAYELPPAIGGAAMPPRADWDIDLGGLKLLGWRPSPSPLVAGAPARVTLAWQPVAQDVPDYKVALRLLDAADRDHGAGDHAPFGGLPGRGTSAWPWGEITTAPHDLAVSPATPPGTYRLAVSVYDPATGAKFPPEAPFVMGEVEVARPPAPIPPRSAGAAHRTAADGAGLRLFGYDLPPGPRVAGQRLPVAAWLEVREPARVPLGASLAVEVVDTLGRVASAADGPLLAPPRAPAGDAEAARARRRPPGAATSAGAARPDLAAGDLLRVPLEVDLPADAGRYALRLRLTDGAGEAVWLWRGLVPARAAWLGWAEVTAPARAREVPPIGHPLTVAVGEAVELLGYDLPAASVPAGGELPVTLYWRAVGPVPRAYRVTVQLVRPSVETGEADASASAPVAQHDGTPADGTRPTRGWAAGEVVVDPHVVAVPADVPPGEYALIAALYDPDAPGEPRPTVRQGGRARDFVLLARVRVGAAAP